MNNTRLAPAPAPRTAPHFTGDPDIPAGIRPRDRALPRAAAVTLTAALLAALAVPAHAQADITVAALQFAHARECNSQLHYGAFARRAERDGDWLAAAAFRAAAVGESVHANRHARELEQLGVTPTWTIESVVVRATEENLQAAIENEVHEATCVYPALRGQAAPDCQYDALAALRDAGGAEATHADLFTGVLLAMQAATPIGEATLAAFPGEPAMHGTFFVCTGDGRVFTHPLAGRCPGCGFGAAQTCAIEYRLPARTGPPRLAVNAEF